MQPRYYKLKLFLLALAGYCYIFLFPTFLLTLSGLFLWTIITGEGTDGPLVFIEIALVVIAARFVRSLWIQLPIPRRTFLKVKPAPKLLTAIDEIRRAIKGPSLHKIVLTDQFEISLTPIPRLGLFGWSRNLLRVGMPVLLSLTPEQFRALVAHELGHLSGSWFTTWIYRLRENWTEITWSLEQRGRWGSWLFNHFFRRYVRYFSKYSLVLARTQENEADRHAARVATPEALADGLVRYEYGEDLVRDYWNDFDEDLTLEARPPASFTEKIAMQLNDGLESEEAQRWFAATFALKTHDYNSHPALKDRLEAIGQEPRIPAAVAESAADVYLGDSLPDLIQQLNLIWEERTERERPEVVQRKSPAAGILSRAYEAERNGDNETALLLFRDALQVDPDSATSHLGIGRLLLVEKNSEGIHFLERAMDIDPDNTTHGCSLIFSYLMKNGEAVRAVSYQRRMLEFTRVMHNAMAERSQVSFVDHFMSHDLPEQEVEEVRYKLKQHPRIREAYLVRKQLQYLPEKPLYVLGLVFDRGWFEKSTEDLSFTQLLPRSAKIPHELHSFVLDDRTRRLQRIFSNLSASRIYRRASTT